MVPLGVNRTWVKYVEKGTFPDTRRVFQVTRCNHCEKAPCVTICPVTAMYHRKDGIVDFSSERCIGCKACMQACPYDAIYIDPDQGTAAKCHFCAHRTEIGLINEEARDARNSLVGFGCEISADRIVWTTSLRQAQIATDEIAARPRGGAEALACQSIGM